MKKTYLFLLILLTSYAYGQIVNIPDAAFKNFLLNYSPAIDTNGDGEIQQSEAEALVELHIAPAYGTVSNLYEINDLTGLEYFTNLHHFRMSYVDFVSSIDLSHQISLTSFDIYHNPSLTCVNIHNGNNTNIDAGNSHIEYLANLQYICLDDTNNPPYMDMGHINPSYITTTDCSILTCTPADPPVYMPDANLRAAIIASPNFYDANHDSCIELSEAVNTVDFQVDASYQVTDLTGMETFINVQNIDIPNNSITTIDLSNQPHLFHLDLQGNNIAEIDLSNNPELQELDLSNTHISNLDISNQTYDFVSLNISNNSDLTYVNYHTGANIYNEPQSHYTHLNFTNLPNLASVCIDDVTNTSLKDYILSQAGHSVTFTDNCTTNVNEYSNDLLKIYPNPTNDIVHIENIDNIDAVSVFDPTGMLVKQSFGKNEISVKNLPAGIYLLRIDSNGNTLSKIIIKK